MKPTDPVIDALHRLQGVVHPAGERLRDHKEKAMRHVLKNEQSLLARWRYLIGGGGLCLLAGLSYATGLVQSISEWIVTVETVDPNTDRVTLDYIADPEYSFTVEVPNTETQELLQSAENNELLIFEVVESEPATGPTQILVQALEPLGVEEPQQVEFLNGDGTTRSVAVPRD